MYTLNLSSPRNAEARLLPLLVFKHPRAQTESITIPALYQINYAQFIRSKQVNRYPLKIKSKILRPGSLYASLAQTISPHLQHSVLYMMILPHSRSSSFSRSASIALASGTSESPVSPASRIFRYALWSYKSWCNHCCQGFMVNDDTNCGWVNKHKRAMSKRRAITILIGSISPRLR